MLIAKKSFNTNYDGGRVQVLAGRDRVAEGHELVARYPHNFAPEDAPNRAPKPRRPAPPSTPPTGRRSTTKHPWWAPDELPRPAWVLGSTDLHAVVGTVALRSTPSPVVVRVSDRARDQIEQEIAATPADFETGGLLLGRRTNRSDPVAIVAAWGPGPAAVRKRDALRLNWDGDLHRARVAYEDSEGQLVPIGMWHTHPDGGDKPSTPDLAVFGELLSRANAIYPASRFAALIAVPGERRPRLAAWVVRRDRRDNLVCERSELTAR